MVLAADIGNSNICIGGLAAEAHRDILFTTPDGHLSLAAQSG